MHTRKPSQSIARMCAGAFVVMIGIAAMLLLANPREAFSQGSAGSITGYAWSDTTGWVSLSGSNYGLAVAADGALSGYAWSDNIGWVSANTADLSGCPQSPCTARIQNGQLLGWLRTISGGGAQSGGWDGFIALGDTNTADSLMYGVALIGGAFSGYAWGSTNVGWLDFQYAATTFSPCISTYQCTDTTHRDDLCTPIVENEWCGAGNICSTGFCIAPSNATGELVLSPWIIPTGETINVSWDASETSSCRVTGTNGDSWYGDASESRTSSTIISSATYTLECANILGTATTTIDTATVSVVPTWVEL